MREVPIFRLEQLSEFGITPAYAGSTLLIGSKPEFSKDHPRVCGKYY